MIKAALAALGGPIDIDARRAAVYILDTLWKTTVILGQINARARAACSAIAIGKAFACVGARARRGSAGQAEGTGAAAAALRARESKLD